MYIGLKWIQNIAFIHPRALILKFISLYKFLTHDYSQYL